MTNTTTMSKAKSQRDANRILMKRHGWPEEIQDVPFIAVPPKEEPRHEQNEDGLVAVYHDQNTRWITGYPV